MDNELIKTELLEGKAQLLDVREIEEWKDGHLKLAHHVPLSSLQEGEEPPVNIDRDKKTYLHCRSGNRVLVAAPLLESMDFSEIVTLDKGFEDLSQWGLESVIPTKVSLNQIKNFKFEFKSPSGSAILDGPTSIGGDDDGLRPMELVLGGIAGCSSFDILSMLRKSQQPIENFQVKITAHRREEVPKIYTDVHLLYLVWGDVEEKQLQRAIKLSMEKYCSVTKMLEQSVNIHTQYEILRSDQENEKK